MFNDAHKYLKRKIKKISYKNVFLPENYKTVEAEYRKLRDNLGMISSVIKSLATYEHGGEIMKQITSVTNLVASKSKLSLLKHNDIYTAAGTVGEIFSECISEEDFKKNAHEFSTSFLRLAEAKVAMNLKLRAFKDRISDLKKSAKAIDEQRESTTNMRYDLEEAFQANESEESKIGRIQAEYNLTSKATLSRMKDFIGNDGIGGILRDIIVINREFAVDMAACFNQ